MTFSNELSGKVVLSIEQAVAGPYCALLLANAGARVIKVERPEGDFARGYDVGANGKSVIFGWLNRGKESICLNLKEPNDISLLRKILISADIFLSNVSPGVLDRLNLTGEKLRKKNSKLITCSISGYGEKGAAAKKKAYDFLVQAESGICSVTGDKDSPSKVGISISDIGTGLAAFSAILRAIIHCNNCGTGIDIKLSMFDVMADWMNMPLLAHRYMGGVPERTALKHSFIAPYGAYYCGDGGKLLLSIQNNREFSVFCTKVLKNNCIAKDPKFSENATRFKNREALDAIIDEVFAKHSMDSIVKLLDSASIAYARLNSVSDLSDHPFIKNTSVKIGDDHFLMASLPFPQAASVDIINEVPELNQHGKKIVKEFGSK